MKPTSTSLLKFPAHKLPGLSRQSLKAVRMAARDGIGMLTAEEVLQKVRAHDLGFGALGLHNQGTSI